MRDALNIECGSGEHNRLIPSFVFAMVLWPIGAVVLFGVLTIRGRTRLLNRVHDSFIRSINFLHADFKPSCYYWAALELLFRSILTGWVLLIPSEQACQLVSAAVATRRSFTDRYPQLSTSRPADPQP